MGARKKGLHTANLLTLQFSANVSTGEQSERQELRWLASKLAWFLVENESDKLQIPDPADVGADEVIYIDQRGRSWGVADLNLILRTCIVPNSDGSHLKAFGCIKWRSDLCEGSSRMLVYTRSKYYGKNRQVKYMPTFLLSNK